MCLAWVEKGGIVGRGVLLDFVRFTERHSLSVDPFSSRAITFEQLQQIIVEDNITIQPADILFIRAGFTAAYNELDAKAQAALAARSSPNFLGVESSPAVLEWIWNAKFAAVASDAPSFEQAPIAGPHTTVGKAWKGEPWEHEMQGGGLLHQWLLAGWGMPIGEMFDLEPLSKKCQELGRWSFFLSSVPLKVNLYLSLLCLEIDLDPLGAWRCREPIECHSYLLGANFKSLNGKVIVGLPQIIHKHNHVIFSRL